ncbi:MFS transporter, ceroid-lipofuscinosis neuronal protein 7 [Fistulifera solaris]|uniref:MFS transporter, ceroid-lipofuscinosis neuronal protein 7 n=1 Tax=Fistulifera solaris TaxID=1519565 RepID=A0A1Z5JU47_FISSO|nr:MFS transporter, ceroid-lipofuscinosis neuronal protein 7 [Fistulifera solaris]|eukprot:GAX17281.1 MFS transporter, ceroid-lipofuscinosis neuronal protein 7 [Fistulifera solaris]
MVSINKDEQQETSDYVNMETAVWRESDESEDDFSLAPSIVSVMSADGIYDTTGFMCICFVTFIGDMTRGVFFPSLWLFVEHLGGSTVTLGYAVAAFSFGRILVNPLFGSWSQTIGYKKTLLIACLILLLGTVLYAVTFIVGQPTFLVFAQTVLGIGSGTLGVTRAFLAEITPQRNRTTYMAWLTATQYAGFAVTPIAGAFFNYLFRDATGFLNMYTAPAFFMGSIVLATTLTIARFFEGNTHSELVQPKDSIKKSRRKQELERVASEIIPVIGLSFYSCCVVGCMLLNTTTTGSIASFETLGIKIAESHFGMLSTRAGLFVGICGSIGVLSLLSIGYISRLISSDVHLIIGGVTVMAFSSAVFMTLEEGAGEYVGTNPTWKYCTSVFLMYAIGYPLGHTAVIGLFSKVVGRRPQGTLQGWYASAGSLARVVFPLLSGYILKFKDVETLFGIITFVLILSALTVLYFQKSLTFLSS